ncbi:MAG: winged helix-turn-helix transcriptional regulator [Xanthobacteraceae bacterium]
MEKMKPSPVKLAANSARRALTILGDRWILLIVRDAFLGVHQFGEWQTRLGITPAVLTRRLKRLVQVGILTRRQIRAAPPRIEYHLTEKGFDIYGIALMVLQWEQRWFDAPKGAAIVLRHARCGHAAQPQFTCGSCGKAVIARDVGSEPGPGAKLEAIAEKRMRRISKPETKGNTRRFLEHAVDILGDRWSWEVVGAAFQGRKRFDDIEASTGMATNILADRLRRLSADGILTRHAYQENPLRYEYVLTAKGRDFFAATVLLLRWGDKWMAGAKGPPLLLFHKTCGSPLNPQVTCSTCGGELEAHEVSYEFADGTATKARPRVAGR